MSSRPKTSNDKAWERLFQKYDIEEEVDKSGCFEIFSSKSTCVSPFEERDVGELHVRFRKGHREI